MQSMIKCNKFIPQAFNNNKCQNCFIYKDNHTTEALIEYSKSTRKIIKYGYLFIAPPELDVNKTKRWQWRFFILYDDGELTYSLDDNPLTLPQGKIYVDKCQEVVDATSITGYPNSLKLAFYEHIVFIAGSGLDDIMKWKETLNSIIERNRNFKTTKRYQQFNPIEKIEKKIDYERSIDGKSKPIYNNNSSSTSSNNNNLMSKSDTLIKDKTSKLSNDNKIGQATATVKNEEIDLIDGEDIDDIEDFDDIDDDSDLEDEEEEEEDGEDGDDDDDDELIILNKNDQKRRYSYKEDDLRRKQRLKENLNQLLIEYKHEEEENMKKLSKYNNSSPSTQSIKMNRSSLDSAKANQAINSIQPLLNATKSIGSLTTTTIMPSTSSPSSSSSEKTATTTSSGKKQHLINSAFKPVNQSVITNTTSTHNNKTNSNKLNKIINIVDGKNTNDDASSYSSASSTSSWSSTSSSNSPPKLRTLTISSSSPSIPNSTTSKINTNQTSNATSLNPTNNYKKPCLISPSRKDNTTTTTTLNVSTNEQYQSLSCPSYASSAASNNSSKSLTIVLRNSSNDENSNDCLTKINDNQSSTFIYDDVFDNNDHENMNMIRTGYLWKLRDNKKNWDKLWFSLNNSSLLYWNDKTEQDLAKTVGGKIELFKCVQIKDLYSNEYDNYAFQLSIHMNTIIFKAITNDVRNNWIQAIKQTIEQTSVVCSKCKPKLVVNPLITINNPSSSSQILSSSTSNNNKIEDDQIKVSNKQQIDTVDSTVTSVTSLFNNSSLNTQSNTTGSFSKLQQNKFESNKIQSLSAQIETLRLQYDKLFNDNNEMKIKFRLLEDLQEQPIEQNQQQQQQQLQQESENNSYDNLVEKLNSIKNSYDTSVFQMQTLDEQLTKYKEQLNSKDREILQLKSQLNNNLEQQQQQATIKSHTQRQTNQNDNWNKEVRNLDARISDVLGKIKERELMLNNYDEWERKFKELEKKYETKTNEIIELNKKLSEKTNENEILKQKLVEEQNQQNLRLQQQQQRKISLHDFDDDLGRVLMSKEDVITQLEKSNEDKDKQIYKLNDDLQQQNLKYQELVQNECKKSQNIINETIQHYSNKLSNTEYEFEQLSNELNRLNIYIDQQDSRINDLTKTKHDLESKVNSINESTRNEIENLQEEVKTLEFKLAHSQKELCDYKNLLNSIDLSSAKNDGKVEKLEQELNEVKNENNYLNEHIYALDEFIRDKEAQNDHYENEIEKLKRLNQTLMNEKQELENEFNNNFILNYFNSNQNELVKEFCTRLNALSYHLNKINENSQVKQIDFNNDQLIIDIFSKPLDEIKNNHQFLSEMQAKPRKLNIKKFKVYLNEVKRTIKSLEKFYTTDILKYNQHVLTYITEQIVHKATLNGHLKFACELLRKKCTDSLILIPNASSSSSSSASAGGGTINNTITTASSTPNVSTSCSQANTFSSVMNNTQINSLSSNGSTNGNLHEFNSLTRDEKICKIASELLLCDEDSLRKISGQVISEVHHLNQLNCVVHALKKIRIKQFNLINQKFLNQIVEGSINNIVIDEDGYEDDYEHNNDFSDSDNEKSNDNEKEDGNNSDDENDDADNYDDDDDDGDNNKILDAISEIYTQHKVHVCDQLNEVHKLMSISSDDDLFLHLQTENTRLQNEISNLKAIIENYSIRSTFNSNAGSMSSFQSSPSLTPTKYSKNFENNLSQFNNKNDLGCKTGTLPISTKYGHILTGNLLKNNLLAQDDTMC